MMDAFAIRFTPLLWLRRWSARRALRRRLLAQPELLARCGVSARRIDRVASRPFWKS